MTRSIILAGLLAAALAACARSATPPIAQALVNNAVDISGFVSYCGPIWSVEGQGYRFIPCIPPRAYETGTSE